MQVSGSANFDPGERTEAMEGGAPGPLTVYRSQRPNDKFQLEGSQNSNLSRRNGRELRLEAQTQDRVLYDIFEGAKLGLNSVDRSSQKASWFLKLQVAGSEGAVEYLRTSAEGFSKLSHSMAFWRILGQSNSSVTCMTCSDDWLRTQRSQPFHL